MITERKHLTIQRDETGKAIGAVIETREPAKPPAADMPPQPPEGTLESAFWWINAIGRAVIADGGSLDRLVDIHAISRQRLRSIEDRLARLDGGPDSVAAVSDAFTAANNERAAAGKEPLSCRMLPDGRLGWNADD